MKSCVSNARAAVFTALLLPALLSACSPALEPSKPSEIRGDETAQDRVFQGKNIVDFGLRGTKKLVLTFDDGPTAGVTDAILDTLKEEGLIGTFFIKGDNGRNGQRFLRRMYEEGHIVANHSTHHSNLGKSSNSFAFDEIESTHEVIAPYMNHTHRMYFRAPYGSWRSSHKFGLNDNSVLRRYIGPIFWDVGGELQRSGRTILQAADWACWAHSDITPADCESGYVREAMANKGGIVLMHDVNPKTAKLLKKFITDMRAAGYTFITLDDVESLDKYQYQVLR